MNYTLFNRLPEDYAFDPDSGIDSDTDMYRMSLKKVLISLIKLYPDVYIDFLNYLFAEVTPFDHFQVAEWRDAEAALSYVYFFGDGCNVNYQQSQYRGKSSLIYALFHRDLYSYFNIFN